MGATGAKVVATKKVFTAEWVRLKCRYGCGGWGKRLTCPPYSPTPEETRRVLDEYESAVLIHCPSGSGSMPGEIVPKLEREAFLAGYYKAFGFASGPCGLCQRCSLKACAHPAQARPAMEASGIDVFRTARAAGFPIEVVRAPDCSQNYYGLVLIE
mgnify:CR=1 FL=1